MSTFSKDPTTFAAHAEYVGLLKTALKKVNPQPPLKFLYYKNYKFNNGVKKLPLVLVDYDLNTPTVLAKQGVKPVAEGIVSLTRKEELDFQVKKGKLNRKALKKYFETMPGTMRTVFVTDDDPDEADEDEGDETIEVFKPLPTPPGQAKPLPTPPQKATATPVEAQATTQAKAKPLPIPAELLQRLKELSQTPLQAEWEAKKRDTLETALELMKSGDLKKATQILDGLASKTLGTSKPLPTTPTKANIAAVKAVKAEILADLEESEAEGDESGEASPEDSDESSSEVQLDTPAAKKGALSPAASVAAAQQRLAEEEAAFKQRKTAQKSEKIKVSDSQQEKAKKEQEAKEAKKAEKAKAKEEAGDKGGLLGMLSFAGGKKDGKDENPTKEEKDKIDRALANKKTEDEIKKFEKGAKAVGYLGTAERGFATGAGQVVGATNTGDDIASAAGSIATSTAGVATSLMEAFREFNQYAKTHGAERTVHLKKAMEALGGAFGNLVNLTKGSLNVAEHSGALEAGSAVPILGIVAAVPTLLAEINDLRSAMTRLIKQGKVHLALEKQIEAGDNSQATLYAMTSAFIGRDTEAVGKGIAKVTLDFTKIAGHGVSAGGITGPIGVALVSVAAAGKLVMQGVTTAEEFVDANKANDRRKKLQPTLNAAHDWKDLRKEKPDAKENVELTQALQVLAKATKGTPEHAEALDKLGECAEAVKKANANSPKVVEYATGLIAQAKQEKESWKGVGDGDEQGQGSGAEDPHQRNARKLIKRDPQVAAQMLIDQAQREGEPGGPAFQVLKSFGIKASQVYGDEQGDDKLANNREIRQKVLYKLGADDESAQTLTQTMGSAKDGVRDYFSMRTKHKELAAYMEAKNMLQHGGEQKRGKGWSRGWQLKMDILTDDVEEKKEALLAQVDYLLENEDIDKELAAKVRALLRPRKEKA